MISRWHQAITKTLALLEAEPKLKLVAKFTSNSYKER